MAVERNIDIRVRLKGADQFKKGMNSVSKDLDKLGKGLNVTQGLLRADAIKKVLGFLVNQLKNASSASIDFESALAGVAKTTDFSEVGLQDFGNRLMELSQKIPATAVELANLAEIAGQLGIAKGDILEFTEVVAAMGVSTNLSAEEAATAFARMANIFGTSAADYSRLGSAVVDLGNNFATTESEIVEMAQNMSGMAALVGMTESDVLAFATALSSIGVQAQAGGSSMQRLFQDIEVAATMGGDALDTLAETAGLTSESFGKLWGKDPAEAVNQFLQGLGRIEEEGGSALTILEDLEIREVRLIRAVLGLANADGLLTGALELSRKAWQENSALTEEAGKRYETTASRIQIAQNKITNAQVTVGDSIKGLELSARESLGDIAADWNEKRRAIDLVSVVEDATAAYEAQKKVIDENAQAARFLTDALVQMGSPEALDASGQKEYAATINALIKIMPDLNKLWDAETMTIDGGTDAIYRNIDAIQRLETAEAQYTKTREAADAYAIIEETMEAQRMQLAVYEAEIKAAEQAYEELMEKAEAVGEANGITVVPGDIIEESYELEKKIEQTQANAAELRKSIADGEKLLEDYGHVLNEFEQSAQGTVDAYTHVSEISEGINRTQQETVAGLEFLSTALDDAIGEYQEAEDAILSTLDGIADAFSMITIPDIAPAEETIESMKSQLDFMEAYSKAIEEAQEKGVSSAIIAQLSSGTEADYQTLASIVSGTEEDIETINAKYAEITTAKNALASELAAAQTDMATTVNDITNLANDLVDGVDVSSEMYSKGMQDIQNLINGINSKKAALRFTANDVRSITRSMSNSYGNDGSHAAGLPVVPYDGYIAELHKGEMVLTALAAKAYRAEQFANHSIPMALERQSGVGVSYATTNNFNNNISGIGTGGREEDADLLAEKIARANKRKARGRGYT